MSSVNNPLKVELRESVGGAKYVDLGAQELPVDADLVEALIGFLARELAPPSTWFEVALKYLRGDGSAKRNVSGFDLFCTVASMFSALSGVISSQPYPSIVNQHGAMFKEASTRWNEEEITAALNMHFAFSSALIFQASMAAGAGRASLLRDSIAELHEADRCLDRLPSVKHSANIKTWINRGWVALLRGEPDNAENEFSFVRKSEGDNSAADMGLGMISFVRGSYDRAIRFFKNALLSAEAAERPHVALALLHYAWGLSAFRGNHSEAAEHFSIAAEEAEIARVPSVRVDALVAQAVLLLNRGDVEPGMRLMSKAYRLDSRHPLVLLHLANHFLLKGDAARGLEFASRVSESSTVDSHIKAYALYLMGKYYHMQRQYDLARTHYQFATTEWNELSPAQYGLAQMYVESGDYRNAVKAYEAVLKKVPDSFEAITALSLVHLQLNEREKALNYAKRAISLCDTDPLPFLTLAQMSTSMRTEELHASYRSAVDILTLLNRPVPVQVWNNLGVLQQKTGNLAGAEQSFMEALRATGKPAERCSKKSLPILFNLARLYEDQHQDAKAEAQYLSILEHHPYYVDCYLRLGVMASRKGLFGDAAVWLSELLSVKPDNLDALCVLGDIYFEDRKWSIGQKYYQSAEKLHKHDAYALVALGNMYYCFKFEGKDKGGYFQKACKLYSKAFSANPRNLYAANGIGIAAAEQGNTQDARAVFAKVREAAPDANVPDFSINLGHLFMLEGAYAQAAQMYEEALNHAQSNPTVMVTILLFLANAYFRQSRYRFAIDALQRAVRAAPQHLFIWSNLALVMELEAIGCLNSDKSNHHSFQQSHGTHDSKKEDDLNYLQVCSTHYRWRVNAITHAEQLLSTSVRLFSWLSTARADPSHFGALTYTHSQRTALKHKTHSEKLLGAVRADLEKVRKLEEEFTNKWDALHTRILAEREEKRLAEEEAAEKERKEREEILQRLEREDEEKQRAFEEMHAALTDKQKSSSSSRKSHRSRAHDDEVIGVEEEEEEEQEQEEQNDNDDDHQEDDKGTDKVVKRRLQREGSGSDEDNNDEDNEDNNVKNDGGDDDLFGGADVGDDVAKSEPPHKRLRKVVGDDDDEDDGGNSSEEKNDDE